MTKLWTVAMLCAGMAVAASGASDAAKTKAEAAKAEAAKAKPVPDPMLAKLPAGAKQVAPNEWEYTDAQGKKWLYRRTPFTLAKLALADNPQTAQETEWDRNLVESTTAVEMGDSIQFTRPGLFGMLKWTANKNRLDPMEKQVWEREQRKKAQASTAPAAPAAASQE
jgi:hypothetical protein